MINSPITNNLNVTKVKSLDTKKIIELYEKDFNIRIPSQHFDSELVEIYKCNETNLKFYANYYKLAGDEAFYIQLAKNYKNYYKGEKWEFQKVLQYFNSETSVLELGSGSGYFMSLLKQNQVLNATGLEMSYGAVIKSQEKGLNVIHGVIEDFSKTVTKKFDIICSFQVFEHLPNIDSTIKHSLSILKEGGVFIISVPNNDSAIFKNDDYHTLNLPPHHVILWDEVSLRGLCKIYNLELIDIHRSNASMIEKSSIYKLQLVNLFGKTIGNTIHTFTRFFVKRIMKNYDGSTIIAVYKKINYAAL